MNRIGNLDIRTKGHWTSKLEKCFYLWIPSPTSILKKFPILTGDPTSLDTLSNNVYKKCGWCISQNSVRDKRETHTHKHTNERKPELPSSLFSSSKETHHFVKRIWLIEIRMFMIRIWIAYYYAYCIVFRFRTNLQWVNFTEN